MMKKTGKADAVAEADTRLKTDDVARAHTKTKTDAQAKAAIRSKADAPAKAATRSKTNKTIYISEIEITVIRSNRRTMILEVRPTAEVIVRAPLRTPLSEIQRFVKEKENWIRKTVAKQERKQEHVSELEPLTNAEMQKLGDLALKVLPVRVKLYAAQMGVTYGRITIRCQKTRWGSCSSAGNLNFNCLLMLAPEEVQNYVVVHELCHRLEMNHSKRFWEQVEKVMPDYKVHQRWLKENGSRLMARRP